MNPPALQHDFQADIDAIDRIDAVPTILDVVCRATGMGFAAVARVTEDRWVACRVLDNIDFGLSPGGELRVESTICNEIRQTHHPVIIDHVATDTEFCAHATPALYGFQSYISMPIVHKDGRFFGTLCAIDPRPARLKNPETIGMFKLFAELIAAHLDADERLKATRAALQQEQHISELREQFVAVLGHDLRNPLAAIISGVRLIGRTKLEDKASRLVPMIQASASRMNDLINNVLDLAQGRMGGGLTLTRIRCDLAPVLSQVIAELRTTHPHRTVKAALALDQEVDCDPVRIAQVASNLVANALAYGAPDKPVIVHASVDEGEFELSVSNGGDPILPQAFERLFEPFTRGDSKPDKQGLGLGLYIASQIAEAHGGTLKASSTSEETRFTLRVPCGAG